MDAVRFGRVLGIGARQAAKTVAGAVDAATAENPSRKDMVAETRPRPATPSATASSAVHAPRLDGSRGPIQAAAKSTAKAVAQAQGTRQGLVRGGKRFGEAVWRPFVRLGGVLWLEVSGVFFGIFALFALAAMWRMRGEWHGSTDARRQMMGAGVMLLVFGYFCVSSFVRAKRRERGR